MIRHLELIWIREIETTERHDVINVPIGAVIVPMHSVLKLGFNVAHEIYTFAANNRRTAALASQCLP